MAATWKLSCSLTVVPNCNVVSASAPAPVIASAKAAAARVVNFFMVFSSEKSVVLGRRNGR